MYPLSQLQELEGNQCQEISAGQLLAGELLVADDRHAVCKTPLVSENDRQFQCVWRPAVLVEVQNQRIGKMKLHLPAAFGHGVPVAVLKHAQNQIAVLGHLELHVIAFDGSDGYDGVGQRAPEIV